MQCYLYPLLSLHNSLSYLLIMTITSAYTGLQPPSPRHLAALSSDPSPHNGWDQMGRMHTYSNSWIDCSIQTSHHPLLPPKTLPLTNGGTCTNLQDHPQLGWPANPQRVPLSSCHSSVASYLLPHASTSAPASNFCSAMLSVLNTQSNSAQQLETPQSAPVGPPWYSLTSPFTSPLLWPTGYSAALMATLPIPPSFATPDSTHFSSYSHLKKEGKPSVNTSTPPRCSFIPYPHA
jgi:hypothetical protein